MTGWYTTAWPMLESYLSEGTRQSCSPLLQYCVSLCYSNLLTLGSVWAQLCQSLHRTFVFTGFLMSQEQPFPGLHASSSMFLLGRRSNSPYLEKC